MIREIVSRTYYRPTNLPRSASSSVLVTLSCGHVKRYKGSQEPNKKAQCRDCEQEKS